MENGENHPIVLRKCSSEQSRKTQNDRWGYHPTSGEAQEAPSRRLISLDDRNLHLSQFSGTSKIPKIIPWVHHNYPQEYPQKSTILVENQKHRSEHRKCMQPAYYWAWYFLRGPFQKNGKFLENLHFTALF